MLTIWMYSIEQTSFQRRRGQFTLVAKGGMGGNASLLGSLRLGASDFFALFTGGSSVASAALFLPLAFAGSAFCAAAFLAGALALALAFAAGVLFVAFSGFSTLSAGASSAGVAAFFVLLPFAGAFWAAAFRATGFFVAALALAPAVLVFLATPALGGALFAAAFLLLGTAVLACSATSVTSEI